ncbi:MAG: hypothetical protein ACREOO_18105 [bacterium]
MIDLDHTKAQMLAEINASEKTLANCLSDPADPLFTSLDEACLVVCGHAPDHLLPVLNGALSKRFADVPPEQLIRDLIYPLKKGLGNAYKWGNQKNPAKRITVEAVATRAGALLAISDEGEGFEVEGILRQFRSDEDYFTHGGSGFVHFNRAKSLISYAHGGRTLLIRFLRAQTSGKYLVAEQNTAFGLAGDEEFMSSILAAELPHFKKNEAVLESLRIHVPEEQSKDRFELKYVLGYRKDKSEKTSTIILSGRLLPQRAAETDFSTARKLYMGRSLGKTGIRIPKPVATLQHPSMALFKFDPSTDLQGYLEKVFDFQEAAKVIKMAAAGLHALHHSRIAPDAGEAVVDRLERHRPIVETAIARFAQASPRLAERARQVLDRLMARAGVLKEYEQVPIHGALGWGSILYSEGKFYFCHFEDCRRSHPGFDLGGYLADLLRFYTLRKKADPEFYYSGREVFLETYFAGASAPWREDLSFFIAEALLLRLPAVLEQAGKKWESGVDALMRRCEQAI